jgi:DNA-binding MarR family transcriptional regulator
MFFSKNKDSLDKEDVMRFFQSLMEASHVSQMFAEKVFLEKSNLTMIQFGILKQLYTKGGSVEAMTDLWCDNHTTRGNLSGVIDRMIDAGLVSRIEAPNDRRRKQIALTKKGEKIFMDIEAKMQKHVPEFLTHIADIPLRDITDSLKKITEIHITSLHHYEK